MSFVSLSNIVEHYEILNSRLALEHRYAYGSRGPKESDELAIRVGYDRKTLQNRLRAGPRDARKRGGTMTKKEYEVYIGDSMNPTPARVPKDSKY